jgi:hypothetical protein
MGRYPLAIEFDLASEVKDGLRDMSKRSMRMAMSRKQ